MAAIVSHASPTLAVFFSVFLSLISLCMLCHICSTLFIVFLFLLTSFNSSFILMAFSTLPPLSLTCFLLPSPSLPLDLPHYLFVSLSLSPWLFLCLSLAVSLSLSLHLPLLQFLYQDSLSFISLSILAN